MNSNSAPRMLGRLKCLREFCHLSWSNITQMISLYGCKHGIPSLNTTNSKSFLVFSSARNKLKKFYYVNYH